MEDQRSWLGTMSKCSQRPPPGHHVNFGPRKERDQIQHVSVLDSDCRPVATCDGCHDFIRTPFCVFKYFMEIVWNLISKGSGLMSISSRSRLQSSIYYRDLFSPRCCVTTFWPDGPCINDLQPGTGEWWRHHMLGYNHIVNFWFKDEPILCHDCIW